MAEPPGAPRRLFGRDRRAAVALGLAASLAAAALWAGGALDGAEGLAVDAEMVLRGPRPADPRVAVVAIDAASVDAFGHWPWPRPCLASLIDAIAAAGARAIALDVVLSEPARPPAGAAEDAALAAAFRRSGRVVLGYFFRSETETPALDARRRTRAIAGACAAPPAGDQDPLPPGFLAVSGGPFDLPERRAVEPNLDLFETASAGQGFFSQRRSHGVQRRYELLVRFRGEGADLVYPALALRAVGVYTGRPIAVRRGAGRVPEITLGDTAVGSDERGALWIDYRGGEGTFTTVSALDVVDGAVAPSALAGRLVFVGATERGIGDVVSTPFAEMPGVEVHANAAAGLLSGRYLHDTGLDRLASLVALLLLGPLVGFLISSIRRHWVGAVVAVGVVLLWPLAAFAAFAVAGHHLPLVPPAAAGGLALLAALPYQVGFVEREQRRTRRTFQRYVSTAVVDEMLAHPERVKLGGERREMTVLFCDIRGFTSISERLDSEALVALLNEFFTPMTRLVIGCGGTLDKYMGDALMAFFGAPLAQPDHAARACAAALAMRDELVRLNAGWRAAGRLPGDTRLGLGVGLNSGEMAVGNMGSEDVFDYTVIGDNVNLGSRTEGLNKLYRTEILATEHTVRAAGDGFLVRELDPVRVKGRNEPVTMVELVARRPADPALEERAARFAEGLAAYRRRDFAAAEAVFAALADDSAGADGPAVVFRDRCRRYLADPPPPGWTPVVTAETK